MGPNPIQRQRIGVCERNRRTGSSGIGTSSIGVDLQGQLAGTASPPAPRAGRPVGGSPTGGAGAVTKPQRDLPVGRTFA